METIKTYNVRIRLTKQNGRYGAAAETLSGELIESLPPFDNLFDGYSAACSL